MKPAREPARNNRQTYFVTSSTWQRRELFRNPKWASLFLEILFHHRSSAYLLHELVVMPDHFHLIITPITSLERAVQFIKGGFSHKAKLEFNSNLEIWQRGFSDHRIRDAVDYERHVQYIHQNPVNRHLCVSPSEYVFGSASGQFKLDPVPQRLKPLLLSISDGTAEAVPLQRTTPTTTPTPTK